MNFFKVCAIILGAGFAVGALSARLSHGSDSSPSAEETLLPSSFAPRPSGNVEMDPLATSRYRLDASQSNFIAHALAGGLLWFKGHEHLSQCGNSAARRN